jgi:hypothetical protein
MTSLLPISNPEATSWITALTGKKFLVISMNPTRVIKTIQRLKSLKTLPNTSSSILSLIQNSNFMVYSGYNCFYGNKPHTSWRETFEHMCVDIKEKSFDVALLAFGGYNYPLCHFIFKELHRTVIHLGPDITEWF